ncbi:sigma-70 family RNA polymerase sigma factor [Acinetobacter gerneri]|uniref:RNA polymerase sigma factor n=1 Tax=Acinetobacter gerneri TaxID=202952 RepID=A0AAW8JHA3_9GAMM|nr:sigma-70 family RNA polymerase sigma factor [Acinetobacter gerneri]MDQ9010725.1 sigma-70 family RNA polymerase sigma factor [Acinetobacter gerneri]MDQ9014449.1 sigma-70 family RNA polymerase sigma factor [Acinetobacter gerneri]MDQ9025620.1 sigma-70 family RNA polymerase sigma factor [Acinetobacter gerneri]MDQ9052901.1 sigma-70 family RNA polymerase sigma factor [Acinetobacter gerneri]MDQ9060496.1 sigma-70 family RNA polymerase sigma factor [Acinetobacter gerneri]
MKDSVLSQNSNLVKHYDELVDYISSKIGNRQIALDVVQETYLRVFQRPEQFINLIHPIAFLKTVSSNIALDHLRKDKNYQKYFDVLEHDEIEVAWQNTEQEDKAFSEQELCIIRQEYTQLILKQINELPPACQDVFLLIQFYGMTQVDTAEQMGISRTMVIKHFTRALQSFSGIFLEEKDTYESQKTQ